MEILSSSSRARIKLRWPIESQASRVSGVVAGVMLAAGTLKVVAMMAQTRSSTLSTSVCSLFDGHGDPGGTGDLALGEIHLPQYAALGLGDRGELMAGVKILGWRILLGGQVPAAQGAGAGGAGLLGQVGQEGGLDGTADDPAGEQEGVDLPDRPLLLGDGHAHEAIVAELVLDGAGVDAHLGAAGEVDDLLLVVAAGGEVELVGLLGELGDAGHRARGGRADGHAHLQRSVELLDRARRLLQRGAGALG